LTVRTGQKQARGRFSPGTSGNPNGRPKGALNRATVAAQTLLDGEAEALSRRAVEMALAGDTTAMRLCLERILPPRKDRPISFSLPEISTAAEAATALSAVVSAVASGEITPTEASEVAKLLAEFVKVLEASELEARIAALEDRQ
jgi:hypothetical protein